MAGKKKHHFVSRWVLSNFSDPSGALTAVPISGNAAYKTTAEKLGFRNNAHRVQMPGLDPVLFEDLQGQLEGKAALILKKIPEHGLDLSDLERETVERFLVLHFMRHPSMMKWAKDEVDSEMGIYRGDPVAEKIRDDQLIRATSWPALIGSEYDPTENSAERWGVFRDKFAAFTWHTVKFDEPSLIVGDILVGTSDIERTPTGAGDRRYGVGIANAERITVPLTPTLGLLLSKDPNLHRLSATAFNRTTVGSAKEFIAFAPSWQSAAPALHQSAVAHVKSRADGERQLVVPPGVNM